MRISSRRENIQQRRRNFREMDFNLKWPRGLTVAERGLAPADTTRARGISRRAAIVPAAFETNPVKPSHRRMIIAFGGVVGVIDPPLANGVTDPFPSAVHPPGNVFLKDKKRPHDKEHDRRVFNG